MNIWITTDTHFGHKMLIEKGYRPVNFEELILKDFKRIQSHDILIHLGDYELGNKINLHEHIEFGVSKILVVGNHDSKSLVKNSKYGFDFAVDSFVLNVFGKRILFSHEPRYMQSPYLENIDMNIHGHTHGNSHRVNEYMDFYDSKFHKEVALENNDYKLFNLKDLINN